jgi:hypothetical protein
MKCLRRLIMKITRLLIIVVCCGMVAALMGCVTQEAEVSPKEKLIIRVSADYPYYPNVDALTEKADLIVKGTVMDSRVEEIDTRIKTSEENKNLNPGGKTSSTNFLYTVYTIDVSDSYKGDVEPGETIEIKEIGGESDTTTCIAGETVKFAKNKEYVMFLSTYESDVPPSLLNPIQSAYNYKEEAANKGKLLSVNEKNDLALTIEGLEEIKNKNKK